MIALVHISLQCVLVTFMVTLPKHLGEKIKHETIITWLILSEDLGRGWLAQGGWEEHPDNGSTL